MTLATFTRLQRNVLLCVGMSSDEVFLIMSHGIRTGVNTDSSSGSDRLSKQEIAIEASVNNDGDAWSLDYMRRDASHLVKTSHRVDSTTTLRRRFSRNGDGGSAAMRIVNVADGHGG